MAATPSPSDLAGSLPWPLPGRTDIRDRLARLYSTDRGYHDLRHLAEVLDRIDELGGAADVDLQVAAWFHDAVYDTLGDNEDRSARLAEAVLTEPERVAGVDVAEVARLVRLTTHHDPADDDHRGAVLCDADLGILAAPAERYTEYVVGVRRDYAHVPDADFRAGRLRVLEGLAARTQLFHTAHARDHWEARARENLAREIDQLRSE
jgi:predicted metal-dependent HD superfamily phosphohydrolase